jgi:outer membrane protein, heavy metal efflux system
MKRPKHNPTRPATTASMRSKRLTLSAALAMLLSVSFCMTNSAIHAEPVNVQSDAKAVPQAAANIPAIPTLKEVLAATALSLEARIAGQAIAGAKADILSADHAPLPSLSAKLSQIDLQNGVGAGNWLDEKRVDKSIGLDWTWERGGKRQHRTRAAEQTAFATEAEAEEAKLQLMLYAQAIFYDWLAANQRLTLISAMEDSATEAKRAADIRERSGDLSEQDKLRIDIDAARVATDRQSATLDLTRTAISLSTVLNREVPVVTAVSANSAISWPILPTVIDTNDESKRADKRTLLNIQDASLTTRADVRAAENRFNAAKSNLDNANALQKSDPTWGISFDHFPGTSTRQVELRVQIPLTLGYRFNGEKARALADLEQSRLTVERVTRDAKSELNRLDQEVRFLRERLEKFDRDVVPQATRVANQAEFAYRRGAISLTDLLDARRTLRATLLDQLAARTDLAKAHTAFILRTNPKTLAP